MILSKNKLLTDHFPEVWMARAGIPLASLFQFGYRLEYIMLLSLPIILSSYFLFEFYSHLFFSCSTIKLLAIVSYTYTLNI